MKTEYKIKEQRDLLDKQLLQLRKHIEWMDKAGIEYRQLLDWAKCIESGKEALDWVLAGEDYLNIVY